MSDEKGLLARGRYATIAEPLAGAADPDSPIQRHIGRLFRQAKTDGIAQPLLVGAIPFDQHQPAALFIPQRCHWFRREQLTDISPDADCPVRRMHQQPGRDSFCRMVALAIDAMRSHRLEKVVLARLLEIETERPLNPLRILRRLNAQNPTCYNFHIPLPGGALVGASPELLVRKQGKSICSLPLAGSIARAKDRHQDNQLRQRLIDSVKDNHEHRLVICAMHGALTARCRTLRVAAHPAAIATPVLWHLATEIQGELRDPRDNVLSVACLLHPTPALCGTPFQAAKDLIASLEPFERHLFGGIVGWCDANGNGEWVVTIRCGEVCASRVRLFAGAGIVADSQPDAEWNETDVKFSTMLRAFGLQSGECAA
ncbi:isochorismate synthase [Affinibrenneria salicis]|uniref:isochorismate synthase n=2 Tax=Affinibrenneria salicis TaxID=2590031 RepID=A0A5J5G418_9GAMM|nr:isochorismate synthase [Affinibrenneria salicis]